MRYSADVKVIDIATFSTPAPQGVVMTLRERDIDLVPRTGFALSVRGAISRVQPAWPFQEYRQRTKCGILLRIHWGSRTQVYIAGGRSE